MRIGIITLSRIKGNQGAFYNLQDVGLAKALAAAGHEVILYRLTEDTDRFLQEEGVSMIFQKVSGIGKQAVTNFSFLDKALERLICFSDNQISFPALCRWCRKKRILLQPYIGVLYSNSPNSTVKRITDLLVRRNVRQYQKMKVYVKTPELETTLHGLHIADTEVVPVCLDTRLLRGTIQTEEISETRERYGYRPENKIILFVGRLEPEKEPLEMLCIFEQLYHRHPNYRLLMVGKGILYEDVKADMINKGLECVVRLEKQIANQEMWQLYGISDCFVNLNRHEIYGMSILEAMYYQCPVIAMHAPGPDYLVIDGKMGYLCQSSGTVMKYIEKVLETGVDTENTRKYIEAHFLWEKVMQQFLE